MFSRLFIVTALIILFVSPSLQAQDSSPNLPDSDYVPGDFQVFTGDGEPVSLDDVITAMSDVEIVFVGETHDDPTGHHLELELFRLAQEAYGIAESEDVESRPVALSLEFFQRDAQPVIDEYLGGLITEKTFRAASRPWPRYQTDYKPLIEYAKENGLSVIAANAPRRYSNRATRLGRESLNELSEEARATIAPLPYGKPSRPYIDQWVQVMMEVMEMEQNVCGEPIAVAEGDNKSTNHPPAGSHGNSSSQLNGQVLWDATMAYWVTDHLVRNPDALVIHMVGSFHVARGTGIPEHVVKYRPGASSMIVMLRPVADVNEFEPAPNGDWGDFVIQTDRSHTLEALECQKKD